MRIVRYEFDWDDYHRSGGECSAVEMRIYFNRFEGRLLAAGRWVRNAWFEGPTCWYGRAVCRLFRWHNVTCRGRTDHSVLGQPLIDPDRWHYRPRG